METTTTKRSQHLVSEQRAMITIEAQEGRWMRSEDRKFKRTFCSQRPHGKVLDHPLNRSLGLSAAGLMADRSAEVHLLKLSPEGCPSHSSTKPRL